MQSEYEVRMSVEFRPAWRIPHRFEFPIWMPPYMGKEVNNMSDNTNLDESLRKAAADFLDKWVDRYGHTKVGKALKFLGFGSK